MADEVTPFPKSAQLARGTKRYRRKVASPKRWQAIMAAKIGPCRVCEAEGVPWHPYYGVAYHHLVTRQDGGDDEADNIVPLCFGHHDAITRRVPRSCNLLLSSLSDAEYAYMVSKGGEDYAERAYGISYERE